MGRERVVRAVCSGDSSPMVLFGGDGEIESNRAERDEEYPERLLSSARDNGLVRGRIRMCPAG